MEEAVSTAMGKPSRRISLQTRLFCRVIVYCTYYQYIPQSKVKSDAHIFKVMLLCA